MIAWIANILVDVTWDIGVSLLYITNQAIAIMILCIVCWNLQAIEFIQIPTFSFFSINKETIKYEDFWIFSSLSTFWFWNHSPTLFPAAESSLYWNKYKSLYRNETGTTHYGLFSTSIWCFKMFLWGPSIWGESQPNFNFFNISPKIF